MTIFSIGWEICLVGRDGHMGTLIFFCADCVSIALTLGMPQTYHLALVILCLADRLFWARICGLRAGFLYVGEILVGRGNLGEIVLVGKQGSWTGVWGICCERLERSYRVEEDYVCAVNDLSLGLSRGLGIGLVLMSDAALVQVSMIRRFLSWSLLRRRDCPVWYLVLVVVLIPSKKASLTPQMCP